MRNASPRFDYTEREMPTMWQWNEEIVAAIELHEYFRGVQALSTEKCVYYCFLNTLNRLNKSI